MIWEALLYATAQSTPSLRRLGLVGDALALRSRALRQRRAWVSHEARCKAFVAGAVAACAERRTAIVLGSGLLRDIPLQTLADAFERLVLVDAVQLLPARFAARRCGAETEVADLSDGNSPELVALRNGGRVDLVVSANLLSQMPLPHRRLSGEWDDFAPLTQMGRRHLADLASFGATTCLVTDVGYRDVDRGGTTGGETPLVDESLLPPPDESWDWEVAPRGEIERGFARIHRVCAWRWGPCALPATGAGESATAPP